MGARFGQARVRAKRHRQRPALPAPAPHGGPHPNACVRWLALMHGLPSRSQNGRLGRGALAAGVSRPLVKIPTLGCGSRAQHASTRGAHPAPCIAQKTSSAEHALPRISLGPGAQPNTHRDRRGPGQLGGEMLRPSIRPDRPRPMRTDGPGRDGLRPISPHFMLQTTWLSPRFN